MKLQNLTIIFIIIIIPIILLVSLYISSGLKTIKYQALYDTGLLTATHDAIYAFELNTTNDAYSNNAETKRNILKASINMFEKSLCSTCGISLYNTSEIEEYIPAIVFGMYDGFYMYAPSYNAQTGKSEHSLKNYVYYSETLEDGTIIRYSLDNYVVVSGDFGNGYETKEGYLILTNDWRNNIDSNVTEADKYCREAINFTTWFKFFIGYNVEDENGNKYLNINSSNNPEDANSLFVQHKRKVIREKIESVLNSSITAYSERTKGNVYKMPKLSEEDWEKIYSNISMITFFQGKSIGLTKYNGYCVLNSTNNDEYVNPNLMYFIDETGTYHDIRCTAKGNTLTGYKIGSFRKKKVEVTDDEGNIIYDSNGNVQYEYIYENDALACYECINGSLRTNQTIYEYVRDSSTDKEIKKAYFTSLAREKYNQIQL